MRTRFESTLTSLLHSLFLTGADKEDGGSSIAKMVTIRNFLDACVDVATTQEATYTKELCAILLPHLRELAAKHITSFFEVSPSQLMLYFSAVFHGECNDAAFREEVCGLASEAEPAQLFHDSLGTAPKLWRGQDLPTFTCSQSDDNTDDIEITIVDGAMAALLLPMCQHTTQLVPWMSEKKLMGADDTRWSQLVNVDMAAADKIAKKALEQTNRYLPLGDGGATHMKVDAVQGAIDMKVEGTDTSAHCGGSRIRTLLEASRQKREHV